MASPASRRAAGPVKRIRVFISGHTSAVVGQVGRVVSAVGVPGLVTLDVAFDVLAVTVQETEVVATGMNVSRFAAKGDRPVIRQRNDAGKTVPDVGGAGRLHDGGQSERGKAGFITRRILLWTCAGVGKDRVIGSAATVGHFADAIVGDAVVGQRKGGRHHSCRGAARGAVAIAIGRIHSPGERCRVPRGTLEHAGGVYANDLGTANIGGREAGVHPVLEVGLQQSRPHGLVGWRVLWV